MILGCLRALAGCGHLILWALSIHIDGALGKHIPASASVHLPSWRLLLDLLNRVFVNFLTWVEFLYELHLALFPLLKLLFR
jgi:hypothetical protein